MQFFPMDFYYVVKWGKVMLSIALLVQNIKRMLKRLTLLKLSHQFDFAKDMNLFEKNFEESF